MNKKKERKGNWKRKARRRGNQSSSSHYSMAALLLTPAETRCAVPIPFIHPVPPSYGAL
jgi:hypothetical protein